MQPEVLQVWYVCQQCCDAWANKFIAKDIWSLTHKLLWFCIGTWAKCIKASKSYFSDKISEYIMSEFPNSDSGVYNI